MSLRYLLLLLTLQTSLASIFNIRKRFQKLANKVKHLFSSPEEMKYRYGVFHENCEYLHGKQASPTEKLLKANIKSQEKSIAEMQPGLEINDKAFYTNEELERYFLISEPLEKYKKKVEKIKSSSQARILKVEADPEFLQLESFRFNKVPQVVDWVSKGIMGPVSNQQNCNACHIITILTTISARAQLKYNNIFEDLSVQEILDCSPESRGCKGGTPLAVYDYVIKKGIGFEKDYPTIFEENSQCKAQTSSTQRLLNVELTPHIMQNSLESRVRNKLLNLQRFTYDRYKAAANEVSHLPNFNNNLRNTYYGPSMNSFEGMPIQNHPDIDLARKPPLGTLDQSHTHTSSYSSSSEYKSFSQGSSSTSYRFAVPENYNPSMPVSSPITNFQQGQPKHSQTKQPTANFRQDQSKHSQTKQPAVHSNFQQGPSKHSPQNRPTANSNFPQSQPKYSQPKQPAANLPQSQAQHQQVKKPIIQQNPTKQSEINQSHFQDISNKLNSQKPVLLTNPLQNAAKKVARFTKVKDFSYVYPSMRSLLIAISEGPVAIAYHVPKSLFFLKNGVFLGIDCPKDAKLNHASIAVGYSLSDEKPYIRLKNSWSTEWGEEGYFRMAIALTKESASGNCMISSSGMDTYPVFE